MKTPPQAIGNTSLRAPAQRRENTTQPLTSQADFADSRPQAVAQRQVSEYVASSSRMQPVAQRQEQEHHAPEVIQLAGKKPPWSAIIPLYVEGGGHVIAGITAVVLSALGIASIALAPVGLMAALIGVGQIIIGISKVIRGGILHYARSKNGPPKESAQKAIASLTLVEGVIATASAIAGGVVAGIAVAGAAGVVAIMALIAKIIGGISSLMKTVRGGASIHPKARKKVPRWTVMLEGLSGVLSSAGSVITAGGISLLNFVNVIVNLVKEGRGGAAGINAEDDPPAQQAAAERPTAATVYDSSEESTGPSLSEEVAQEGPTTTYGTFELSTDQRIGDGPRQPNRGPGLNETSSLLKSSE